MRTIHLDINKKQSQYEIIIGRVGDYLYDTYEFHITDGYDPVNLNKFSAIAFEGTTSADKFIRDTTGVTIVDAAKGIFTYKFPSAAMGSSGEYVVAYFSLTNAVSRTSTSSVTLRIEINADISKEAATNFVSEYDKLIKQVSDAYDKYIKALDDKLNGKITEWETRLTYLETRIQTLLDALAAVDVYTKPETIGLLANLAYNNVADSDLSRSNIELLNAAGRSGSYLRLLHATTSSTTIASTYKEFTSALYNSVVSSDEFVRIGADTAAQSSTGYAPAGFMVEIDFKSMIDSISPNILSGLSVAEQRARAIQLNLKPVFSADDVTSRLNTSNYAKRLSVAYQSYYSGAINSIGTADVLDTSHTYMNIGNLLNIIIDKISLDALLGSDLKIRLVLYSSLSLYNIVIRKLRASVNYSISLDMMWMPRSESYTREQIQSQFVKFLSGDSFTSNAPHEYLGTDYIIGDRTTSPSIVRLPNTIQASGYVQKGFNTLTLSDMLRMKEITANDKAFVTTPSNPNNTGYVRIINTPVTEYNSDKAASLIKYKNGDPVVVQVDVIGNMLKEYPNLFKGATTREERTAIAKKLGFTFSIASKFASGKYGTWAVSAEQSKRTPAMTIKVSVWNASTSKELNLKSYDIDSYNPRSGTHLLDATNVNLDVSTRSISPYVTDTGYVFVVMYLTGEWNPDDARYDATKQTEFDNGGAPLVWRYNDGTTSPVWDISVQTTLNMSQTYVPRDEVEGIVDSIDTRLKSGGL